jgi:hypothetical protein
VGRLLDFRNQVVKLPAAQQNLVRRQNEVELIGALRTEQDSVSTLLLEIYDLAHPPIAAGVPALTRQQADAALELFYFMAGQLEGVQATPNDAAKKMWAGNLARTWATLPIETRKAIAAMPVTWALTLAVWTNMFPAVREQVKATYAQMDVVKALRSDFVAARNQAAASALSASSQPLAAPPQAEGAVDVSAQISKMNANYAATSSMLTSGYNSTINMMAAMGNMSGPRYKVR